jgi:hypothetical protein
VNTLNRLIFILLFLPLFALPAQAGGKKNKKMLSDSIRKYQKQANFRALIPFLQEKKDLLYAKGDTAGPEMAETLGILQTRKKKPGYEKNWAFVWFGSMHLKMLKSSISKLWN